MSKRTKSPLNVHGYENKIRDAYQKCVSEDTTEYESFDCVIEKIHNYISHCQCDSNQRKQALNVIRILKRHHKRPVNTDKTNSISIEEILPKVWKIVENYEHSAKMVFIEQLTDILKGSCAQGRNIRLVQFYIITKHSNS